MPRQQHQGKGGKPEFLEKLIMFLGRFLDLGTLLNCNQIGIHQFQIDLFLCHAGADVAGDVQVVSLGRDSFHRHTHGIAFFLAAILVCINDLGDVLGQQAVLTFAFFKVFAGVDKDKS